MAQVGPSVLVVCPDTIVDGVRHSIGRVAPADWERQELVKVLVIPRKKAKDQQFIASQINSCAATSDRMLHVVTIGGILVSLGRLRADVAYCSCPSLRKLEGTTLPMLLGSLGLDLAGYVETVARGWEHGLVDRERVLNWLAQFERLGRHRWVGERLLRVLEFWTGPQVLEALGIGTPLVIDTVCINRFLPGKSSDSLATKMRKRLDGVGMNSTVVRDFAQALEDPSIDSLIFVEDCLISGNEISRVLRGLLGKPSMGSQRTAPLADAQTLRKKRVKMRFAVVANAGLATLTRLQMEEDLPNLEVEIPQGQRTLAVLTEQGLEALKRGDLYDSDGVVAKPETYISRLAFSPLEIWGNDERRKRATGFCAEVGAQLYRHYLVQRGKDLPDRWADQGALGVLGFALALAFAHSVPKETLPVFWMGGSVKYGRSQAEWIPLFENAL